MGIRAIVFSLLLVTSAVAVAACGGGDGSGVDGLPECPSGGTSLTYDNFGKKFFDDYCTSCHFDGTTVKGAPPYDTAALIQASADEIYERAAGSNPNMPQSGKMPTDAEREQLTEWLSCGAK